VKDVLGVFVMAEETRLPPQVQQRLLRLQQLQQTLQDIVVRKQQLELELSEVEQALKELNALSDDAPVYKSVGALLVRADRSKLIEELNERKEILNMRVSVLGKQEERIRSQMKELQEKLQKELGTRT